VIKLIAKLPDWIRVPRGRIENFLKAIPYYGKERYCPVCGNTSSRFKRFGTPAREDAECVYCHALERHRLLWFFLKKKTDLFNGQRIRMLHVAAEPCFQSRLKKELGSGYLTADLFNSAAMVKMDVCNIQYADQSFDVIYCSHVLEHVLDDKQAMREFFRVLKNDGWAILLVPIGGEKTFEDPSIVDPKERFKAFGQEDHVRLYGPDYIDRLREVGFAVEKTEVSDLASGDEAVRMGLTIPASGEIYYCTK